MHYIILYFYITTSTQLLGFGGILLKKFRQVSHYYLIINYDVLWLLHVQTFFNYMVSSTQKFVEFSCYPCFATPSSFKTHLKLDGVAP